MVLTFNIKSKGKSGVVEYFLDKRVLDGTAYTKRGNPELTKTLIRSQHRAHKYKSGSLVFHKDDKVTDEIEEEIMNAFEDMVFVGIDQSQYNILWVKHVDKGRVELNFVIVREDLASGKDLDIHSHKRDLPLFNMWKNGINKKYGFVDPEAKSRKRTPQERAEAKLDGKSWLSTETSFIAKRADIEEKLVSLAQSGKFESRDQMISFLENEGYEITRKNDKGFSVKHPELGKTAKRLQDNLVFTSDFKSLADIQNAPEVEIADKPIYFKRSLYLKYLDTRRERHLKKYSAPVPEVPEVEDIEIKEEDEFRNTEVIRTRDEEAEGSRRRIAESARRARERQDEVLSCLREYGADNTDQGAEAYRERVRGYIGKMEELAEELAEQVSYNTEADRLKKGIEDFGIEFGRKIGDKIRGIREGIQEGLRGLWETAIKWVEDKEPREARARNAESREMNREKRLGLNKGSRQDLKPKTG